MKDFTATIRVTALTLVLLAGGQALADGLIEGDVAIRTSGKNSPLRPSDTTILNNAGATMIGDIEGDIGTETLINEGSIVGNVMLGQGADLFDNTAGELDGWVSLDWGDDIFRGGASDERVDGGRMDDDLSGGDGDDLLLGGGGDDSLVGGGGDDRLRGNRGDDTVKGGGGDDNLKGNGGADVIRGN